MGPPPPANRRFLIVNADDFGFTHDVNAGIVEAHRRGILTAATIMANGPAFDDAVRLAREHPTLDIGVHLVLVGAPGLPATVADLLHAIARGKLRIFHELRAQIQAVIDAGLAPTHLDTHKHTHLLPPILTAVARLSEEFGIPWVRRPMDFPMHPRTSWQRNVVSRGLGALRGKFHRVLSAHGCRTTDHFAGFQITGLYDAIELAALIRALPKGSTELMCHPGFCRDELRAARTRLKESREQELLALVAPQVHDAICQEQVELLTYPALERRTAG